MRKIDKCIGIYDLSKTLRFRAIPVGKTMENIVVKRVIEEDEKRSHSYKNVKKYIDRYHIFFIDEVLNTVRLESIQKYSEVFFKKEKTKEDKEFITQKEEEYRKQISSAFMKHSQYKSLFGKEMITELLPKFIKGEEELKEIESFAMFTTAFTGFHENRKNMYVADEQSTAISYRCINENLPKFLRNMESFKLVHEVLGEKVFETINEDMKMEPYSVTDCFTPDFFNWVLSQKGITVYNTFLGGMVREDGAKVQGINEYINLYNQQLGKEDRNKKLPQLTPLYKQILSDRESMSFYIDEFDNDKEVEDAVINSYIVGEVPLKTALKQINTLFDNIYTYSLDGIYVSSGPAIDQLSNGITQKWDTIRNAWNNQYDRNNLNKTVKNIEKYIEERNKIFKKVDSFSLSEIGSLIDKDTGSQKVTDYYRDKVSDVITEISIQYETVTQLLEGRNKRNKLQNDDKIVSSIKDYLDSIKELDKILKPLKLKGHEADIDSVFYGIFNNLYESIAAIDYLYNKVRNYLTKKPYSINKYKLYFDNPQLLGGWDRNKEEAYRSTMLFKDDKYYLVIIDKSDSKVLSKYKGDYEGPFYEKLNYKLLPGPNKMLPKVIFSKTNEDLFHPSMEIKKIYNTGSFKKGEKFNIDDCHKLIDYYKECIKLYPNWSEFDFKFSDTSEYEDIAGFYRDVEKCGYKVGFDKISERYIDELVDSGKIYLFQIYNKDFSECSHGTQNLHTMYFKALFDNKNKSNNVFKLSGGAELFIRPASIKKEDLVIHPKNQPIETKNPNNMKKSVKFEYDIIKDKRFSEDQFMIHIPIQINRSALGAIKFNDYTRKLLRECDDNYVVGIDRGERNLLYVCVINSKGKIVEQFSLNEIINEHQGTAYKVDYHSLLDTREKERTAARQNWKTIENIKELKEGYIGQVVHKICQLVIKYDAVIAMEDLNFGFKRGRTKFEKQVYQKFEKMLIEKLNYMVDKQLPVDSIGGVFKGYQLTNKFKSFREMGTQNGFIFYIPAWLTSKIDPTTGFVDLLKPKYSSIENTKNWISLFDSIYYDEGKDMFAFKFNYEKFDRANADFKKEWIIYSNGERIHTFRNPNKNNEFDYEVINLTKKFKLLFEKYEISFLGKNDIKSDLCNVNSKEFFVELISLLRLVLQMRNSITGDVDTDYLISPVLNQNGKFFDSREYEKLDKSIYPVSADANGAFNIARKALWAIEQFKEANEENISKIRISISNKEWLQYAQTHLHGE